MPGDSSYVPNMAPPVLSMTADELLNARLPDKRTELVRGSAARAGGLLHGRVAMNLGAELRAFAKETRAGAVLAAETGDVLPGFACPVATIL